MQQPSLIIFGVALLIALPSAVSARGGGHRLGMGGFGHSLGGRGFTGGGESGGQFASDRRHGNDAYAKAASDEVDKLLDKKLKSICRGC